MSTIASRTSFLDVGVSAARVGPAVREIGRWTPELGCPRGVLITGATRRIGRAVALELGRLGWHVVIHHRHSGEDAQAACTEIRDLGGRAEIVKGDFESGGIEEMFAEAVSVGGPMGLLINNASIYEWDDLDGMTQDGWMRHQTVNALAPVMLMQAFARALPGDSQGSIVNIIDSRVLGNRSRHFSYSMSKAGLWTATRLLARELAPRVRVNAIGPGPTLPEAGQTEEAFQQRCEKLPLGRGASLQDIADAVAFLAHTPSITGQFLALDGGDHLVD
jgi:NAD(P)-dependent dehydrogenase (short-subunit alcohol dehydrogenase family)